MLTNSLVSLAVILGIVALLTPFLGRYIATVMEGGRHPLVRLLGPVERGIYRVAGVDPAHEQGWRGYAVAVLLFSLVSILALYVLQRAQGLLPLNPTDVGAVPEDLALNTAVSFIANTNWQNYAGESTMAHLTQAAGLAVQNFVSAAVGLSVAIALVRGLTRRSSPTIGNFWSDIVRATLYVLLPLAFAAALVLVWQGVPQTFAGPATVTGLESTQTIYLGPIASQEAIKELGTNGGGIVNANSAHPFENPTAITNLFEQVLILIIPFALTATFGVLAGDRRQGWVVFAAMAVILAVAATGAIGAESQGNPLFPADVNQALGSMEGKELRLGASAGGLFAAITTGTSTGAVNAMHDSFTPLGGLVPMFLMLLGEITPGGVGAGLYGMLVFALLTVFIAGLMVGRTPEYLGKKVESFEMKMSMLVVLVLSASILGFTALAVATPEGRAGPLNAGPHGFSEIFYAFASQTGNNGSAFGGLTGNTSFYNVAGALAMLIGRFAMIIPILAIAGSLAAKRRVAVSAGTFSTSGATFVILLIGVVVIVGALNFLPAMALGPIVEHLLQQAGVVFP